LEENQLSYEYLAAVQKFIVPDTELDVEQEIPDLGMEGEPQNTPIVESRSNSGKVSLTRALHDMLSLASLADEQAEKRDILHKTEVKNLQMKLRAAKRQATENILELGNSYQAQLTSGRVEFEEKLHESEESASSLAKQLKEAEHEKTILKEATTAMETEKSQILSSNKRLEEEKELAFQKICKLEKELKQFLGNDLGKCDKAQLEQLLQLHEKSMVSTKEALAEVNETAVRIY
jgi:chromosome segregation ATPase